MARRIEGGDLSPNANTVYSKPFRINSNRVACVAQVANGALVDLVVQGAITDGVWGNTALAVTGANNSVGYVAPADGDGTIVNAWPLLRVAATSTGANTVKFRLVGIGGDDD